MINITKNQFLQFIRTKKDTDEKLTKATQHYLDYYDKYISTGKKGNWNFAAFFNVHWFFYRCMYLYGCLAFVGCVIPIIPLILYMRYADYLYLKFAFKKISKGKSVSGINRIILIFSISICSFITLISLAIS